MTMFYLVEHGVVAFLVVSLVAVLGRARDLRQLCDKYRASAEERRSDILRWCVYKCPHKESAKSLDGLEI